MAKIIFKNVKKVYPNNVEVVHGFNLEIKDKEFVVFVGPSGCGKSTTLRMIAGLEDITSGELYIGDKIVNNLSPKERDIAMVFQNYALYPHMTVRQNMSFGLELRKVDKNVIKQKIDNAAKILGLTEYLERKPSALSGGQRQRVALGRSMVREPKVFLLDEPLSNLDAKLRTQMRVEIASLHKRLETTFVYVTHDQTEAMTMGDRIVVMKDGYIQQVDTPINLYNNPCNIFVAGFIGTPQMNFIDVQIKKKEKDYYVSFGKYEIKLPQGKVSENVLKNYDGKIVSMGIRPEHLHEEKIFFNEEQGNILDMNVEFNEMLGSEVIMYLNYDENKRIVAKIPNRMKAAVGEKIKLAIDTNKVHLFDKQTEKTICN